MLKRILIFLCLILITAISQAKDITLLAASSLPPYIIQESGSGIEYTIIKEALAKKGYTLKLEFVPFVRVVTNYNFFDGAITINEDSGAKGFYSDTVITYRNYPITLAKNKISIKNFKDLKNKRIVAFQNAKKYLGEKFAKIVARNENYSEQGKQAIQVKMLYSQRADVIISDINIFKYYRKRVTDMDTSAKVVYHEIFPGTDYKVLFKKANIRDDFNIGLKELKASGRYQEIIDSYLK